jgi:hypothetical protein
LVSDGVAYRTGKSDTPVGIVVADDPARALPVAVGDGNFDGVLVQRGFTFYCAGNFSGDAGGQLQKLNLQRNYFTPSGDI